MRENATTREPEGTCRQKASANGALSPAAFRFGLQSTKIYICYEFADS